MKFFAILGSHPEISLAELEQITKLKAILSSNEVAVFETDELKLQKMQNRLGGTSKLGEVFTTLPLLPILSDKKGELVDEILQMIDGVESKSKLSYGISVYDLSNPEATKSLRGKTTAIGLTIKKRLKENGRSVRYVTSKEPTLSSVVVTKNKLAKNRTEFVLLVTKNEILLGRTQAVQDFEAWSHRDYDRPARDAKRGMLPPKLARMMINLTGINPQNKTLLDPFCGSGTVLMEGALLGCNELFGSDLAPEAVTDTQKNLEWLEEQNIKIPEYKIFESAAGKITDHLKTSVVDLIVTEPYLGKPRRGSETKHDVKTIIDDLIPLYQRSFSALAQVLKNDGVIVVAFPIHFVKDQPFELPIDDILTKAGLQKIDIANQPLIYRREDQFVGRQLIRCQK